MRLESGGIDIFYVDESGTPEIFAFTAIAIPFLRQVEGVWTIVWPDHFEAVKDWRRYALKTHGIPMSKEFHGVKLAAGRGRYRHGKQQFSRKAAAGVYRDLLSRLSFFPEKSIISVVATGGAHLYDKSKWEAALMALFQRMQKACSNTNRNGLVFFDEGHGEFTKLYRRSLIYLPTGSMFPEGWDGGQQTRNIPMALFTKDGNIKRSHFSYYTQVADLIVYALFLKIGKEQGTLHTWQEQNDLGDLYDQIPLSQLNTRASHSDRQGIVRLAGAR
ncbi:MAG: DUF3800 domain-containing protein [Gemmatimonadota bacterium]|nr:MAG: DUF3800 domain-containing protein [Gemmatimonadota bacterium]